jgi:hypothetical protein
VGSGSEPIVRLGEQAGDVSIGTAAQTVNNNLADLPPALAEWAADQQEVALRMVDALDRVGAQVDAAIVRMDTTIRHLKGDIELYRALDGSDRAARRKEADQRWWGVLGWVAALTVVVAALVWLQWVG